jgi:hypothetical protein
VDEHMIAIEQSVMDYEFTTTDHNDSDIISSPRRLSSTDDSMGPLEFDMIQDTSDNPSLNDNPMDMNPTDTLKDSYMTTPTKGTASESSPLQEKSSGKMGRNIEV